MKALKYFGSIVFFCRVFCDRTVAARIKGKFDRVVERPALMTMITGDKAEFDRDEDVKIFF